MRIAYAAKLRDRLDLLEAAHVGTQNLGDRDGAVSVLVVLQNGCHGTAGRQTGTVEGVQIARTLEVLGVAILDVGATGLEVTTVGAGADLLVGVVARQPDLDVVGLTGQRSPGRRCTG